VVRSVQLKSKLHDTGTLLTHVDGLAANDIAQQCFSAIFVSLRFYLRNETVGRFEKGY
jgi:hypothetical protein